MLVHIPGFDLALTANSGQSFRFNRLDHLSFELIASGRRLRIEATDDDRFHFSCEENEFEGIWQHYFDLSRDYVALGSLLPAGDAYLNRAHAYAKGVRILRQEPFETLICFIISQRKSIPAIKACVKALSERFGEEITPGHHAFPTPSALAEAPVEALAACGLGYRVPYVQGTAKLIRDEGLDLNRLQALDDAGLEQALLRFPGVGKKVAACVMLFAYQRMDAFPVDVWIQKVLAEHFKEGFPYEHFGGYTGILQQYLFCYARHLAGRDRVKT